MPYFSLNPIRTTLSGDWTPQILSLTCQVKALNKGGETKKGRGYFKNALVVVDELGYQPLSREEAHLFFQFVSYRYERGSTIITSNKSVSEWGEFLGDDVLAAAILDRLLHHCHVVNIQGRSYRLRHFEERRGQKQ